MTPLYLPHADRVVVVVVEVVVVVVIITLRESGGVGGLKIRVMITIMARPLVVYYYYYHNYYYYHHSLHYVTIPRHHSSFSFLGSKKIITHDLMILSFHWDL